jgi:CheY-like chemotaxis protein
MQILVVEDSPVYRQLLTSHLREWSFPFAFANGGSKVSTILQEGRCQTARPRFVYLPGKKKI